MLTTPTALCERDEDQIRISPFKFHARTLGGDGQGRASKTPVAAPLAAQPQAPWPSRGGIEWARIQARNPCPALELSIFRLQPRQGPARPGPLSRAFVLVAATLVHGPTTAASNLNRARACRDAARVPFDASARRWCRGRRITCRGGRPDRTNSLWSRMRDDYRPFLVRPRQCRVLVPNQRLLRNASRPPRNFCSRAGESPSRADARKAACCEHLKDKR